MKINEILKDLELKQVQRWTLFSQPATNARWFLFLLPAVGGLIAGIIIFTYAPEAEGHGTDAVIDAYNNKRGFIRKRVPIVKAITSMITIGSGGSAGRKGPIAQIGAGFGSTLATFLKLSDRDRRIMVICGTAAGIGSIFKAPLGGSIFAIEVLYKGDMETEGLVPAFISSTIAYSIFSSFFGWGHIFVTPSFNFTTPTELIFYGILGILCAATAILFVIMFYGLRDRVFRPLKLKPHFKPAIGGLLVGIIAIFFPQVLGTGYGWVQIAMNGDLVKMSIILMMVASTPAYVLSGKWTIYEKQVENRASSPAHRREMVVDILERARVEDAMNTNIVTINSSLSIQEVLDLIHKYGYTGFPVVDDKKLVGIITFEDAEKVPSDERKTTRVEEVMTRKLIVAKPKDSLEAALMKLLDRKIGRLPVVDNNDPTKLIGLVTKFDIIKAHAKLSSNR